VYLIKVYFYIKYVTQIDKKEKWMNRLYLKFVTQTKFFRQTNRSGQTFKNIKSYLK